LDHAGGLLQGRLISTTPFGRPVMRGIIDQNLSRQIGNGGYRLRAIRALHFTIVNQPVIRFVNKN